MKGKILDKNTNAIEKVYATEIEAGRYTEQQLDSKKSDRATKVRQHLAKLEEEKQNGGNNDDEN